MQTNSDCTLFFLLGNAKSCCAPWLRTLPVRQKPGKRHNCRSLRDELWIMIIACYSSWASHGSLPFYTILSSAPVTHFVLQVRACICKTVNEGTSHTRIFRARSYMTGHGITQQPPRPCIGSRPRLEKAYRTEDGPEFPYSTEVVAGRIRETYTRLFRARSYMTGQGLHNSSHARVPMEH